MRRTGGPACSSFHSQVVLEPRRVFRRVVFKYVLLLSKGLVRDQHTRRQMMFYALVGAMLMLFFGGTFLQGWLREHVVILLVYWAVCGWITLLAALLAIFDMLLLRIAARAAKRQLEAEYLRQTAKREQEEE
jgi:hypothetical protein